VKGWYFLTGSAAQIDELMKAFRLVRQRENDGEVDHVLEYFLVSPDGHPMVQYSQHVEPSLAAGDAEEAVASKTLIGRLSLDLRHLI
jgi:cytochrome oxidase Cu insertion factor (SCO1/SenC/PrrC family)